MKARIRIAPHTTGERWLLLACVAALMQPAQSAANSAPVAVPGGPYFATPGWIVLDGTASWDPDIPFGDRIVDYTWSFSSRSNVVATGVRPQVSTYLLYDLAAHASPWSPIANPITGLPAWSVFLTATDTGGLTHTAVTSLRFLDGNYQVPSVPEPANGALLGAGLGVLAWGYRRRQARPSAGPRSD